MRRAILVTLLSLAALAASTAGGCKKKAGNKPKPSSVSNGGIVTPPPSDGTAQASSEIACSAADVGYCVCVEGGFEISDGTIWDFACCVQEGPAALLVSCGDGGTCDPETFTCVDL